MRYATAFLLGLSLTPLDAGDARAWWWSNDEATPSEAPVQPQPAPQPEIPQPAPQLSDELSDGATDQDGGTSSVEDFDAGADMLSRGAELLFEGLRKEMAPALGELRDGIGDTLTEIQPALRDLSEMIGDMRHYEAPVQLPNGDIVIRRKGDAPPFSPRTTPDAAPEGLSNGDAIDL
ncbi:hypothetical protein [Albirhodobacter sp. R86504]|uniref:hypothetical protein n=1 Tax=Albirhodobacter sp. R86504 TaxID=3093848 RepID=UPI00366C7880